MKNNYFLIFAFFLSFSLFGQADLISYQAVILNPKTQELPGVDASSNLLTNTLVNLKFSIVDENGNIVFQEEQKSTTDAYGLINIFIGEGTQLSSTSFNEIKWDGNLKTLKVEIDFEGGESFVVLSEQKLTFTPVAYHRDLYAANQLTVEGETQLKDNLKVEGFTTFENDLQINGNLQIEGPLQLNENAVFEKDVDVNGNANLNNNLNVANDAQFQNKVTINGLTDLNDDLNVATNALVGQNLEVAGASNFNNVFVNGGKTDTNLTVEGNTVLNNDLEVGGNTLLKDNLVVTGNVEGSNNLNINGTSHLNGSLDVAGATHLQNSLMVEGATTFNNNVNLIGNTELQGDLAVMGQSRLEDEVTILGRTSIENNLYVQDATTLDNNLSVSGDAYINDNLTVNQNTVLQDGLLVKGISDLENNVRVFGQTDLNGTLKVTGISSLESTLSVADATHLNHTLNVIGETTLDDVLNVNANSFLQGTLNVNDITSLNNNLNVTGLTTLNNQLNLGDTHLSKSLTVDDTTLLNQTLEVLGATSLAKTLNVGGDVAIQTHLMVDGNTQLNSNLDLVKNADIHGSLNVDDETRLRNVLHVFGNTRLHETLNVEGTTHLRNTLKVYGKTTLANLIVQGDGTTKGKHIALFKNTAGGSADGIAIQIDQQKLSMKNNFITFYGKGSKKAGRIESYDLLTDSWGNFPKPQSLKFTNLFSISDNFNDVFFKGKLPELKGGRLPSLEIESITNWNFDEGKLPTLIPGKLPSIKFSKLFKEPTVKANVIADDFYNIVSWADDFGLLGMVSATPWEIALGTLKMEALQLARDQGVVYGSKGADYAEWLEKENLEEEFVYGEVVGVKNGKISKITEGADQVMSISRNPIVLGNMPQDNDKEKYEKVGFLGQVPVLVIGNVNVGDYIVASGLDDGYAKAISPSDFSIENVHNLIGKAWSASTPNIVNYINVSVGLNNKEWVNIVKLQNKKIEELNEKAQKLEDLIKRVEKLETRSLEFSN